MNKLTTGGFTALFLGGSMAVALAAPLPAATPQALPATVNVPANMPYALAKLQEQVAGLENQVQLLQSRNNQKIIGTTYLDQDDVSIPTGG